MSADSALIDEIVRGVLVQLGGTGLRADAKVPAATVVAPATDVYVQISERIVTAGVLNERVNGSRVVVVGPKALVTPAAWDLVRERNLTLRRGDSQLQASDGGGTKSLSVVVSTKLSPLLIVVRNSDAVERLWTDLQGKWRRELLGCPDDAAKLAIAELSRGGASSVVILAEQTHRAACLANRNDAVKAVAVRDAADVPVVRKQLRANVWCVDPSGRSWFELKNLLRAIDQPPARSPAGRG